MEITFVHNGVDIPLELTNRKSCYVKLYNVPTDYSSDGYYIAHWLFNEIEPVPGCLGIDAHLLCYAEVNFNEMGEEDTPPYIRILKNVEECTCHA